MRHTTRRGIAAIEVALVLPVLVGLLYVLVEGGAALKAQSAITEASRSAARQVIISGETSGVQDIVETLAPTLSPGAISATATTSPGGDSITVEVTYDYQSFFNANPTGGDHEPLFTLAAQTSMPLP